MGPYVHRHCRCLSDHLCCCDVIPPERLSIGEITFGLVFGIAWVVAFLACVLPGY